jgi:GNAT superfamily N-acetyltransferase
MPPKKPQQPPDPNRLIRVEARRYRSADDRFEVRDGGTGWFLTDAQQRNDFGQELVTGPYATLATVRETLPEARRTTLRPLPRAAPRRRGKEESGTPEKSPAPRRPRAAPEHRLVRLLRDAARGRFPKADLAVEILDAPPGASDAVVAFSGHNIVAAGVDAEDIRAHLPGDDPGGPLSAPFLTWLGLQLESAPGSVDVVLIADGTGLPDADRALTEIGHAADVAPAFADRVARAQRHRSDVRLFTDDDQSGIVILGRGLAERREVSLEVHSRHRGRGIGVALARAARGLVAEGEPLYAQVAPGNVASLRAFLRGGYRPIGAEVLFLRRPPT